MIHILTGDGKGKTTSAIGMAIRAAGNGKKVVFLQFLKGIDTGEVSILQNVKGIVLVRNSTVNSFEYKAMDNIRAINNDILDVGCQHKYDMLILDEIAAAYNKEYIDKDKVDSLIDLFPLDRELVLTGRDANARWINQADYVSEIRKIKHPFDKGVKARRGIEM